jgi:hypothetical protein
MLMVYMSVLNCSKGIFDSLSTRYHSPVDVEVVSVHWFAQRQYPTLGKTGIRTHPQTD